MIPAERPIAATLAALALCAGCGSLHLGKLGGDW